MDPLKAIRDRVVDCLLVASQHHSHALVMYVGQVEKARMSDADAD